MRIPGSPEAHLDSKKVDPAVQLQPEKYARKASDGLIDVLCIVYEVSANRLPLSLVILDTPWRATRRLTVYKRPLPLIGSNIAEFSISSHYNMVSFHLVISSSRIVRSLASANLNGSHHSYRPRHFEPRWPLVMEFSSSTQRPLASLSSDHATRWLPLSAPQRVQTCPRSIHLLTDRHT
jgi:hypothetical protein